MTNSENKFEIGEMVVADENPGRHLIVRRYFQRTYYCAQTDGAGSPDLVYFENELQKVNLAVSRDLKTQNRTDEA